jgi:Mrp family chromosome partitioning ATPase
VALGRMTLGNVMKTVSGVDVVPAGSIPPNPGELVGSREVAAVLAELRNGFDLVFVDTPPILVVGDALKLTAEVDGVIVVSPVNVRKPMLTELRRALDASPAAKLGVVLTGIERDESAYGYGYGYIPHDQDVVRSIVKRRSAAAQPQDGVGAVSAEVANVAHGRWQIHGGSPESQSERW